ncbi:MAG: gliding motility-associated C-terminal domain-containing protein [Bacteroidota bacterium]|nr:MAG: gliding motility-associated C-terminal domain-containing protein [Bacteroidota bacterium]
MENDLFRSKSFGGPDAKFTSLSVYNRWGNKLFYTEDELAGWDGTFYGSAQSTDTYFFLLKYSCQGEPTVLKGNVILVR